MVGKHSNLELIFFCRTRSNTAAVFHRGRRSAAVLIFRIKRIRRFSLKFQLEEMPGVRLVSRTRGKFRWVTYRERKFYIREIVIELIVFFAAQLFGAILARLEYRGVTLAKLPEGECIFAFLAFGWCINYKSRKAVKFPWSYRDRDFRVKKNRPVAATEVHRRLPALHTLEFNCLIRNHVWEFPDFFLLIYIIQGKIIKFGILALLQVLHREIVAYGFFHCFHKVFIPCRLLYIDIKPIKRVHLIPPVI